jgi:hypothetical protein
MTNMVTATTHDATFGVVSVTKRSNRPYSHAVIRVSDAGDVSASFHMTRAAAEKAGGRPAFGITRHVVPVAHLPYRNRVADRNTQRKETQE